MSISRRAHHILILFIIFLIAGLSNTVHAKSSTTIVKAKDSQRVADMFTLTDVDIQLYTNDFEEWGDAWASSAPTPIWFRWKTGYNSVGSAKWTVLNADKRIVAQGVAGGEPASAEAYQEFIIDFTNIVNNDSTRPLVYTVEVTTFSKPSSPNTNVFSTTGSNQVANMIATKVGTKSVPVTVSFIEQPGVAFGPDWLADGFLFNRMDIAIDLEELTIYGRGYDEDPYLLVAAIYMDGTTITPTFDGSGSRLTFGSSSVRVQTIGKTHENVPGGDPGDVISIPPATGHFETKVTPIGLDFARSFGATAAQITALRNNTFVGIVVIGLEEDAIPSTEVMNGARDLLIQRLTEELNAIVQGVTIPLPLQGGVVAFDVDTVIEDLGKSLKSEIEKFAADKGSDDFYDLLALPGWPITMVFGGSNQDDYIGQDARVFSYEEIMQAGPDGISFELTMDQNCSCNKVWLDERTEEIFYEITGRIRFLP